MAKAAQEAGFDVQLITNLDKHQEQIESLGITVHPFSFERKSLNPIKAISQIYALRNLYKQIKPQIIHHIAMKPILYGSIASLGLKNSVLNAFAGLGFVFSATSAKARIIRTILVALFHFVLKGKNKHLLFQNTDDKALFKKLGLINEDTTHIIKGSGVDLDSYEYNSTPKRKDEIDDFIVSFAGRMISIKGIQTLKDTFEILEDKAPYIKLQLCGQPDPHNPESWTDETMNKWSEKDNVTWLGQCENMADIWKKSHAAIQISYGGEGVPKSLIEAAACGKPIIASMSAGCRDMISTENKNGILVPIKNAKATAEALIELAHDKNIQQYSENSRQLVKNELAQEIVIEKTKALYQSL